MTLFTKNKAVEDNTKILLSSTTNIQIIAKITWPKKHKRIVFLLPNHFVSTRMQGKITLGIIEVFIISNYGKTSLSFSSDSNVLGIINTTP